MLSVNFRVWVNLYELFEFQHFSPGWILASWFYFFRCLGVGTLGSSESPISTSSNSFKLLFGGICLRFLKMMPSYKILNQEDGILMTPVKFWLLFRLLSTIADSRLCFSSKTGLKAFSLQLLGSLDFNGKHNISM